MFWSDLDIRILLYFASFFLSCLLFRCFFFLCLQHVAWEIVYSIKLFSILFCCSVLLVKSAIFRGKNNHAIISYQILSEIILQLTLKHLYKFDTILSLLECTLMVDEYTTITIIVNTLIKFKNDKISIKNPVTFDSTEQYKNGS